MHATANIYSLTSNIIGIFYLSDTSSVDINMFEKSK